MIENLKLTITITKNCIDKNTEPKCVFKNGVKGYNLITNGTCQMENNGQIPDLYRIFPKTMS